MGPSKTKTNPQMNLPSWPSWFNSTMQPIPLHLNFHPRHFFRGRALFGWPRFFNPIPFGDRKLPSPTLRTLERMSAKTWKALHLLLCWKGSLGFFKKRMLHTGCLIERKPNCFDCIRAIFWSCHSWMELVGDGGQLVCKKQEPKKWEKHVFIICLSTFFFGLSLKKSGGCLRCACISLPKKELLCRSWGSSTVFWELGILQERNSCGAPHLQTTPQKRLQVSEVRFSI